jgi:LysM repeat protein
MAIILKKLKEKSILRDDPSADWEHILTLIKIMAVLFILFSGFHWIIIRKVQTLPTSPVTTKIETKTALSTGHTKIYTVRSGDTLWSIASQQYPNDDPAQKVKEIKKINQLAGKSIRIGQPLKLP